MLILKKKNFVSCYAISSKIWRIYDRYAPHSCIRKTIKSSKKLIIGDRIGYLVPMFDQTTKHAESGHFEGSKSPNINTRASFPKIKESHYIKAVNIFTPCPLIGYIVNK